VNFPSDWPYPLRRIVQRADNALSRWEDAYQEAAPWDLVEELAQQAYVSVEDALLEMYDDEIEDTWLHRWQRGRIEPEIFWLLYGETSEPIRINGEHDKYLRRVPTTKGKKRFRYIYDPKKAFPKTRKKGPRKEEKLLVSHKGQRGHYEVADVEDGKAIVEHDETGHRMRVEDKRLYDLFRDANDPGTLSEAEQKRLTTLEKADRLPRSRAEAYAMLLDASSIGDSDFSKADAAYLRWYQGGKRGKKPPPLERDMGALSRDKRRGGTGELKPYSSLLEAFMAASKGAKTWRDLLPAVAQLQTVPGFENVVLPDEVYARHIEQNELLKEDLSLDPEKYGERLERETPQDTPQETPQVEEDELDNWIDELMADPFYEDPI